MLKANKSVIFEKIFSIYNRNLLRRRFHSFQVSGLEFLLNKDPHIPLIIYCNHSSWWDGLAAFQISREVGLDSFIMMEEKQLKRLFLFRKLGAFSVDRENPREAYQSITYASEILQENSNRTLWIFPQGKILHIDRRPVKFYGGLAKITEKIGKCSAASLAMRYEFLGEFKPQIFVKIKKPEIISVAANFDAKRLTDNFSNRLTENLDELKFDVINQHFSSYKSIL